MALEQSYPVHRYHRVGRGLSFFLQSSELGRPHLLTRRRMCPPLGPGGEGAHSLGGEGLGGPNFDEGTYSYTVVLCKYMYFVIGTYSVTQACTFSG